LHFCAPLTQVPLQELCFIMDEGRVTALSVSPSVCSFSPTER
jgi:hypothetical protein